MSDIRKGVTQAKLTMMRHHLLYLKYFSYQLSLVLFLKLVDFWRYVFGLLIGLFIPGLNFNHFIIRSFLLGRDSGIISAFFFIENNTFLQKFT